MLQYAFMAIISRLISPLVAVSSEETVFTQGLSFVIFVTVSYMIGKIA